MSRFQTTTAHAGRYDRITIALHWATAALVLLLWTTSQVNDLFPKGAPRIGMRSVHILLGVTMASVLAWRITWRATRGRLLTETSSPLGRIGSGVHQLLYVLLVCEVLLGLCNVWVRGDWIFHLFKLSPLVTLGGLRHEVASMHRWVGHGLLGVACLHAFAALFHHHVLRDGILTRMWPARRTPA